VLDERPLQLVQQLGWLRQLVQQLGELAQLVEQLPTLRWVQLGLLSTKTFQKDARSLNHNRTYRLDDRLRT